MSDASALARARLRWSAAVLLAAGVAVALAILGYFGLARVWASLAEIGWRGLVTLSLASLAPLGILGAAWWALEGGPLAWLRAFVWARAIRDAATELLPFSQFGGFAIGARAAVLSGVPPARASAGTVVDVTAEMIAQLGFTGLGLAILDPRGRQSRGRRQGGDRRQPGRAWPVGGGGGRLHPRPAPRRRASPGLGAPLSPTGRGGHGRLRPRARQLLPPAGRASRPASACISPPGS